MDQGLFLHIYIQSLILLGVCFVSWTFNCCLSLNENVFTFFFLVSILSLIFLANKTSIIVTLELLISSHIFWMLYLNIFFLNIWFWIISAELFQFHYVLKCALIWRWVFWRNFSSLISMSSSISSLSCQSFQFSADIHHPFLHAVHPLSLGPLTDEW